MRHVTLTVEFVDGMTMGPLAIEVEADKLGTMITGFSEALHAGMLAGQENRLVRVVVEAR